MKRDTQHIDCITLSLSVTTDGCYAVCRKETLYAECCYSECHYVESHYAECRGAYKPEGQIL
jgi:hypothetical protein